MELQTSEGPKCKTKLLFLRTLNKRTSTTRSSCLAEAGRGNGTASALIFVVYNCYQHELVPLLLCSSFLIKRVCMCLLLFMLLVLSLYGGIVMFSLSNMEDGSSHSHQLSQLTKSLHPEGFSSLLSFAFLNRRPRSPCRSLPCLYHVP